MRTREGVPVFCSNFKTVEYLLSAASAWAAIMLILTPTVLRKDPPPFFSVIRGWQLDWPIGAACLSLACLHFFALRMTSCGKQTAPCDKCAIERRRAAWVRACALLMEVTLWYFFTACYVVLALQGVMTLASGLCLMFAVCASLASYCISREMARDRVHLEAEIMKRNNSLASE